MNLDSKIDYKSLFSCLSFGFGFSFRWSCCSGLRNDKIKDSVKGVSSWEVLVSQNGLGHCDLDGELISSRVCVISIDQIGNRCQPNSNCENKFSVWLHDVFEDNWIPVIINECVIVLITVRAEVICVNQELSSVRFQGFWDVCDRNTEFWGTHEDVCHVFQVYKY